MSIFPIAVQDERIDGTLVVTFNGRYVALQQWEIQDIHGVTRRDREGVRQSILIEGMPVAGELLAASRPIPRLSDAKRLALSLLCGEGDATLGAMIDAAKDEHDGEPVPRGVAIERAVGTALRYVMNTMSEVLRTSCSASNADTLRSKLIASIEQAWVLATAGVKREPVTAREEVARLKAALRSVIETLEGEPGGTGKAIGIAAEALEA